jgi:hypothetical protein
MGCTSVRNHDNTRRGPPIGEPHALVKERDRRCSEIRTAKVEAAKARGSFTADHIREIDAKSGGRLGVFSNRLGSDGGSIRAPRRGLALSNSRTKDRRADESDGRETLGDGPFPISPGPADDCEEA